jgi:hypothetical protein
MAQVINKRTSETINKADKSKLQDIKKITPKSKLVTLRSATGEKRINSTKTASKNSGRVTKKKI